jgi:hypothetical protein
LRERAHLQLQARSSWFEEDGFLRKWDAEVDTDWIVKTGKWKRNHWNIVCTALGGIQSELADLFSSPPALAS